VCRAFKKEVDGSLGHMIQLKLERPCPHIAEDPRPSPQPVPLKNTTFQQLGPPWCDVDELDDNIPLKLHPAPNVKHFPHPTHATVTILNPTPDMISPAVGVMMDAVNRVCTPLRPEAEALPLHHPCVEEPEGQKMLRASRVVSALRHGRRRWIRLQGCSSR
jgi:hypothetical protein